MEAVPQQFVTSKDVTGLLPSLSRGGFFMSEMRGG